MDELSKREPVWESVNPPTTIATTGAFTTAPTFFPGTVKIEEAAVVKTSAVNFYVSVSVNNNYDADTKAAEPTAEFAWKWLARLFELLTLVAKFFGSIGLI